MSFFGHVGAATHRPAFARGRAIVTDYLGTVDALLPLGHWRLNETSGTVLADRVGTNDATAVNSPTLGVDPLVQDSAGGKSIGLKGGSSAAHATIENLASGAVEATFDLALQLDEQLGAGAKFMVLDNGSGNAAGQASIELQQDAAESGVRVRCWSTDPDGTPIIKRTAAGTVPIGEGFKLSYRRNDDGTQSVLIDGVAKDLTGVSGADPPSWPALAPGTWTLGAFVLDTSISPFKGVLAELVVWERKVSDGDLLTLARAQDVVWLADSDVGSVNINQTTTIDLAPLAHPATGFTPTVVSDGSLGNATESGENIDYAAHGVTGTDDTFTATITRGGLTSRTATFTIDVIEQGGLTLLSSWPLSETS